MRPHPSAVPAAAAARGFVPITAAIATAISVGDSSAAPKRIHPLPIISGPLPPLLEMEGRVS